MARIVIVDDTAVMRSQLRYIFERRGDVVVAEAENGKDAILAYKQHLPDLLTLDINMPVMSGVEAAKEIKAEFPEAKIVMISSESERGLLIRVVKSGVTHYILKPFEETKVLQVVEHLLGSKEKTSERMPHSAKASSAAGVPQHGFDRRHEAPYGPSAQSGFVPSRQGAKESSKRMVNEYLIGKVVTENVYNKQGKLLLRAGKTVSETMVELLKKNNIRHVKVE
ncbi:response regulator [Cohnella sp. CFH 77786]|uniref:response regulator n=1 Tax=Cohnella sp. CFH 77786 TaxID=2662265 RepID=UPI001C61028E|nr:response regulator [Cohnella sp. CFH 77786]MBW5449377.1 response regulator [Cohnella sp. CFH 77786]